MTRTLARPRLPRLTLMLLALASFAAFSPPAATAQSPAPTVLTNILCDPANPVDAEACLFSATPIEPDGSLIDPQPVPFDHVTVGPDGRTLTVYFWMGVQDCNGLHSVVAEPTGGGIELTVLTGIPEDALSRTCVAIAQLYSTVVTLDEPLIVPGTEG